MDLMKNLRDVPSPRPEAYDRARTALQTAMAEPAATVVRPKRRLSWPKVSVAAVGAAAVAAAVVIGTSGGSVPAGPAGAAPAPAPQAVEVPLVKLASAVQAAGTQPGDASLIVNEKFGLDNKPDLNYTLYTDKGDQFTGDSAKSLVDAVAKGDAQPATPYDRNVMAAARLAANGDVDKARIAMITASGNPLGVGLSPAEADKAWAAAQAETAELFRKMGKPFPGPKPRPTGKDLENLINNHLLSNIKHALFANAADAEVRAGVLKLYATIPDMIVGKTSVDGQAALSLTAPPAILDGSTDVLIINAGNGLPIREEITSAETSKHYVVNYKSSRVTIADVAAGKI
ncbi:hypothetical protein AMES_6341 [Amycolatopsis mediterranei S699]|uniref:Uncharacterized protein n=3 Tax=Amycolatopsis mediterranei TaxID=33910 RepID=A0A0H3DBW6_AMYMU|nr:hypothetical protein AMED_6434 [Amycolatopsis mediterranei U32]AEK45070.1 hypothetical protein RAM_32985 [Amycolatopsis mediterranei S699]AGT87005.1 hypothetical protein B737_6341 [Amycolatopsis mediterranei RB]KDO10651.1 hypothetical protein DV26_12235 [Amycolatopsis mediterranei]AFO79877.1 hypothetical protein AMES_6341 [Amycolatopsis mediterranei S699]